MATTVHSVQLKLAYSDATSKTITFNDVDNQALYQVKDKVNAINANMPAPFANTFVSSTGAPCTMIAQAKIIVTTEDVIYNAG